MVAHFGEVMDRCETSCDVCTGIDLLAASASASLPTSGRGTVVNADARDGEAFEALRELRRRLADERGVPAYVIFNDATLLEMAASLPTTEAELLSIGGVGPKKLAQYGEVFLAALQPFASAR